jgi:predicted GIY-YIG superfamily endonuclease
MGVTLFDRKFGSGRLRELPREPGVYLFLDAEGQALYVGKARDLRRRLAGYRNASRRKAHRKMRRLVRLAVSLEIRPQESETQALLLENELIRTLRPPHNVDGAYAFLYPTLGVGQHDGRVLLAFTSTPDEWSGLEVRWHGCFRSRVRARSAFDALVALFARVGHREPTSRLPDVRPRRGARLEAFRRVPSELAAAADAFLSGDSTVLLGLLFERLLESAHARRQAADVEQELRILDEFARKDVAPLRRALRAMGRSGWVSGDERDALAIASGSPWIVAARTAESDCRTCPRALRSSPGPPASEPG